MVWSGYEPGGREFESLRARHFQHKQQDREGFASLFYMLVSRPVTFIFLVNQQVIFLLECLVGSPVVGCPAVTKCFEYQYVLEPVNLSSVQ
jgi:hypothetical protein